MGAGNLIDYAGGSKEIGTVALTEQAKRKLQDEEG
jgi:hypothetical protein